MILNKNCESILELILDQNNSNTPTYTQKHCDLTFADEESKQDMDSDSNELITDIRMLNHRSYSMHHDFGGGNFEFDLEEIRQNIVKEYMIKKSGIFRPWLYDTNSEIITKLTENEQDYTTPHDLYKSLILQSRLSVYNISIENIEEVDL